jgi:hypothetical protein
MKADIKEREDYFVIGDLVKVTLEENEIVCLINKVEEDNVYVLTCLALMSGGHCHNLYKIIYINKENTTMKRFNGSILLTNE